MEVLNNKITNINGKSDLKKQNISANSLDKIFAELFSSVNLSENTLQNSDKPLSEKDNFDIISDSINKTLEGSNGSIDSESSEEIDAAKSLISIFFENKEFLNNETKNSNTLSTNASSKKVFHELNHKILKRNEKLIEKNNFLNPSEEVKTIDEQKTINIDNKKIRNFENSTQSINGFLKKSTKKKILEKLSSEKPIITKKIESNFIGKTDNLIQKKNTISKNKDSFQEIKIEVDFISPKKNKIISKPIKLFNGSQNSSNKNPDNNLNNIEVQNNSKSFNKESIKNSFNSNLFQNEQFLDMLESGWGEKFVKSLKQNIEKGNSRIDFTVKPKNLGKVKVEINLEDGKTKIKINTDNKTIASIFAESHSKLVEILDKDQNSFDKNLDFSFHSDSDNRKNFNNNNENNNELAASTNQKQTSEKDDDKENIKKKNHKVDINA